MNTYTLTARFPPPDEGDRHAEETLVTTIAALLNPTNEAVTEHFVIEFPEMSGSGWHSIVRMECFSPNDPQAL